MVAACLIPPRFPWRRLSLFHGDTYELWPRQSAAEEDLANLKLPINLDTSPSGIGGGTNFGPRPLYPHMHLLPSYETLVVTTKCASLTTSVCYGGRC